MAKLGIDNVKGLLNAVTNIMCDAIKIVRGGIGFGAMTQAYHLLIEVRDMIAHAPGAIPELADLDDKESAELGALAYASAKKILDAVKGF